MHNNRGNKRLKILLILAFVMFVLSACSTATDPQDTVEALSDQVIAVNMVQAQEKDLVDRYMAIGEVVPEKKIDLYANGGGSVESLLVKIGDSVTINTPLISLSDSNVSYNYKATESSLRTLKETSKLSLDQAQASYEDSKVLYDKGAISQNALESAESQYNLALKQYQDAVVNYNNQVNSLKDSLDDRVIRSPIDGTVAAINVNQGDPVSNQLAVTVIDQSKVRVKTAVPGEIKKTLETGDKVYLYLDGHYDQVYDGQVIQINEIPDLQTKLFEIEIESDTALILGDYVEVGIVKESVSSWTLPASVINREGNQSYIYISKPEGVEKVEVETGLSDGEWIGIELVNKDVPFDSQTQIVADGFDKISVGQVLEDINKN